MRERCADSGVGRATAGMCRAGHIWRTPYLLEERHLLRGAAAVSAAPGAASAPRRRRATPSPRYVATCCPRPVTRRWGAGGCAWMAPPLSPQHTSAAHGRALHHRAGRASRCTSPAYAGRARAVRERGHAPLCSRLQMSGGMLHTRRGTPPRRRHPAADAAGHGCGPAKRARRMRPAAPRRAASAARAACNLAIDYLVLGVREC